MRFVRHCEEVTCDCSVSTTTRPCIFLVLGGTHSPLDGAASFDRREGRGPLRRGRRKGWALLGSQCRCSACSWSRRVALPLTMLLPFAAGVLSFKGGPSSSGSYLARVLVVWVMLVAFSAPLYLSAAYIFYFVCGLLALCISWPVDGFVNSKSGSPRAFQPSV